MDDLISREAAIDAAWFLHADDRDALRDTLRKLPSVSPVKHGKWILVREADEDGNALYECSNCHKGEIHVPIVEVRYCWNCGARMDDE